jgi:shikimate kinase
MSIPEIFEQSGEPEFRKLESEALSKVLGKPGQVIAIGGGAPCNEKNIRLIKEKAISFYLKISIPELMRRLASSDTPRPLLAGRTPDGIRILISELLESREKFYLQADQVVESDSITAESLAGRLMIDD